MSLIETTLFQTIDKVQNAIQLIRDMEPAAINMNDIGYHVAFSGGKDSIVVYDLIKKAGVKHEVQYNLTTVDPPELVQYIKRLYPEVRISLPELSMWQLIVKKRMPPTRMVRYCCSELKERAGQDMMVATGIRAAESTRRAKRKSVEACLKGHKMYLNPIISWSDEDVWEYIRENNLEYCKLYDEGFKRIGCVLCPMDRHRADYMRWPEIKRAYIRAFQKMIEIRHKDGLKNNWTSGQDVFDWWIGQDKRTKSEPDQEFMFD